MASKQHRIRQEESKTPDDRLIPPHFKGLPHESDVPFMNDFDFEMDRGLERYLEDEISECRRPSPNFRE